jgi:ubiquinone/menaquinone biosynthesis C-methylase UbiE
MVRVPCARHQAHARRQVYAWSHFLRKTGFHFSGKCFEGRMSSTYEGHYPLENRSGEIERLHTQGAAMAPDTGVMLDRIGVRDGWQCLDIGCGPRGITDLLGERVGPGGRVVGLDMNERFLAHARAHAPANVEFRQGDAFGSDLPAGTFDLVHMRFVGSTAGDPERLLAEAMRLARPGGVVAMQEPDVATLHCHPPHPAWARLKEALLGAFASVGADLQLARKLYLMARQAGLQDVQFRPFVIGVRASDPMVDYLPATVESLRATVLRLGLLSAEELDLTLSQCREHLHHPDTSFTLYTVAQVWGRTRG